MSVQYDFRVQAASKPWACILCQRPTDSWHIQTSVAEQPIDSICGLCALEIVKVVLTSPDTGFTAERRRHIAQEIKASLTRNAVAALGTN